MKPNVQLLILCFALAGLFTSTAQSTKPKSEKAAIENSEYQTGKWRISANGGFGYRLGSTKNAKDVLLEQGFAHADVDDYFKQIKSGYKVSGQVHYMFRERFGFGFDYQFHTSNGALSGYVDPGDMASLIFARVSDNIYTNYFGASFYAHDWIKPGVLRVYSQVSLGVVRFRQETVALYNPLLITGNAFAGNAELGLEYFLLKNVSLALNTNIFQSTITKIHIQNGSSAQEIQLKGDEQEGLGRIDVGLGLKFYF